MCNAHFLGSEMEKKENNKVVTWKPQVAFRRGERDRALPGNVKNRKEELILGVDMHFPEFAL